MMVSVPSIAAVSYLNTIPFIYGIRHEGNFRADLLLSPPSECTKNYVEGRADLALLPAAAVPSLKSTDVITEYCIGAVGPVRTVVLLSDGPVSEVRRVFLDPHSQTSVQLVGYLAAHRWKIAPEFDRKRCVKNMNFHEIVAKFKHYWYNKNTYKGAGKDR